VKPPKAKEPKKPFSMTDFLLGWTFAAINIFVVCCLIIYCAKESVPEVLVLAVFGFFGFECGVMGAIKINRNKKGKKNKTKNEGEEKDGGDSACV